MNGPLLVILPYLLIIFNHRKVRDRHEIQRKLTNSFETLEGKRSLEDVNFQKVKVETFSMLYLLMTHKQDTEFSEDYTKESVLHVFATVDYHNGVEVVLDSPYKHSPDLLNSDEITPLLVAVSHCNLKSAREILNYQVNVKHLHPKHRMTACSF